ncbi:hypothetical protein niasHS_002128 [Heterodera schachtii]|uniref:Transmembrane protein n=1 Tax=Heterodera schachtii TaxID=97005 RepID=A0ABD2KMD4_HETSC
MLLFWPLTDDEDVEDKEDDWEFCCGTIHSFIGTSLFMAGDLLGLPSLLAAYVIVLHYLEGDFTYVHFWVPIVVLTLGIITSFFGAASIVRLYLCLFRHRCSPLHDRIVTDSMSIYLYRLSLLSLFSVSYVSFIFWQLFGGPRSPEDICDWERLWGFFHCLWVWVRLTLLAIGWAWIAMQYFIGALCCRVALNFVKNRYRGYWNEETA